MLTSMLAHGGDASGLGMLAFFPIGLLLLVGIIIALRPAMTGTDAAAGDEDDDESADPREPDEHRRT
jgi:hypothetical protein